MLCPNCGANVGDQVSLCSNCAKSRRTPSTVDMTTPHIRGVNRIETIPASKNFHILMIGIAFLSLIFIFIGVVVKFGVFSQGQSNLNPAQQVEIDSLYQRCKVVFEGSLKMQKEIAQRAGGTFGKVFSGMNSFSSLGGMTDRQCEDMRKICESDFDSRMCKQERQTTALFFVLQNVCHSGGLAAMQASMSSPECQELYATCVGGPALNSSQCQNLLKRHGV